jgi:acetyl esterase
MPEAPAPHPVYVHLHGGGFRLGTIYSELNDARCRHWAAGAGCAVLTVEYRLAPEHPFPRATEDCYAALLWATEGGAELGLDASRIAVGGDSAGANLATVVALMARDRNGPRLVLQVLEIPCVDVANTLDYPSAREFGSGYGLTSEMATKANADYLERAEDATNPYASPILADVTGLPAALVLTAEFDILRDSGEAYARRLEESGVPTTLHRHAGHIHGSSNLFPRWEPAREWMDEIARALRSAFER